MLPQDLKQRKFWGIFALIVFGLLIWLSIFSLPSKARLPVIAEVPEWTLIAENQQPYGSKDLKGKIYLANFFFSRCPSVCPKILRDTGELQKKLEAFRDDVVITSFTVDPEFDTPDVLKRVSHEYDQHGVPWVFLTSESKDVLFRLYKDGFKVGVGEPQVIGDIFEIAHTEKMVLIDQAGRVRGFYGYTDENEKQLIGDVADLVEEE